MTPPLLLVVVSLRAASSQVVPNRTTLECPQPSYSQYERLNCTLTTRDIYGQPTAGASATDFFVVETESLTSKSAIWGGPIQWNFSLATCPAGNASVIVLHGDSNVTTTGFVLPHRIRNFSLDCGADGKERVAGDDIGCRIITYDGCGNPTEMPTEQPS